MQRSNREAAKKSPGRGIPGRIQLFLFESQKESRKAGFNFLPVKQSLRKIGVLFAVTLGLQDKIHSYKFLSLLPGNASAYRYKCVMWRYGPGTARR